MGEYTTFHCEDCGYDSGPVRWGVSVEDPRRRYMPALCMTCSAYVEVDLTGADMVVDEFHCGTCGSDVFFVKKADRYACPSCRSEHVRLTQGQSYW